LRKFTTFDKMKLEEFKEKLAEEIRYRRIIKLDISQEQLAEKSGLGLTTIKNLEGEKANPSLETIEKLAIAFGIQIEKLLCFDKKGREKNE